MIVIVFKSSNWDQYFFESIVLLLGKSSYLPNSTRYRALPSSKVLVLYWLKIFHHGFHKIFTLNVFINYPVFILRHIATPDIVPPLCVCKASREWRCGLQIIFEYGFNQIFVSLRSYSSPLNRTLSNSSFRLSTFPINSHFCGLFPWQKLKI